MEEDYHAEVKRLKTTTNPWERVIQNVEINSSQYVGSCDVSRMRQKAVLVSSDAAFLHASQLQIQNWMDAIG